MSLHIQAKPGQVAETVLLAGDPLRARYIAENFLEDAECYNELRAMYGYTGHFKGKRISVQGSGMGMPSTAIYARELIRDYGVKRLIRVGSAGTFQDDIHLRDIVLALSACSDSAVNTKRFRGMDYAPTVTFALLQKAWRIAQDMGLKVHVGSVLSTDTFYDDDPDEWKLWARYGVLAAEMESAALYTIAAEKGVEALTILTVSDSLVDGGEIPPEERENTFADMAKLGLEVGIG